MFKYLVAILSGASITGSVYMAGWGTLKNCPTGGAECEDCAQVDVGNTKCAVMGDDVGDSKVTVSYNGYTYHMCCEDCVETFKKEPSKYVAKIQAEPLKYGIKK